MQKSRDTTSRESRSPVTAIIAAVLVMALSFMAFDANTLSTAFADDGVTALTGEVDQDQPQADDDSSLPVEGEDQTPEEEQPAGDPPDASEPETGSEDASARAGPDDEQATSEPSNGDGQAGNASPDVGEKPDGLDDDGEKTAETKNEDAQVVVDDPASDERQVAETNAAGGQGEEAESVDEETIGKDEGDKRAEKAGQVQVEDEASAKDSKRAKRLSSENSGREAESEGDADEIATAAAEEASCVVTFYSKAASQGPSVLARKLVSAEAGQMALVSVADVTAPAPSATEVFDGWIYAGDVVRDEIRIDPRNGNVNLYPSFTSGHWLRFSTGVEAGAATGVDSRFVAANETAPTALPVSERVGYAFDGWFEGWWDGETVVFGAQVTDASGSVGNPAELKAKLVQGDVELFAKWSAKATTYRLVSWHENPDDEGYSYQGFELIGDEEGERAIAGEMTDASAAPAVDGFTATYVEQRVIKGDGSTVAHAYYDRNEYSLVFHQGISDKSPIFEELTITAKHGADVHDRWPKPTGTDSAYTSSWYTLPNKIDDTFVNGINTMPLGGAHFYLKTDSGMNFNTVFLIQDVNGSNTFSTYVTQPFSAAFAPGTTPDDYMAIKGFMVNAASSDDAVEIMRNQTGDKLATHDPDFKTSTPVGTRYDELPLITEKGDVARYTSHFYYLRCVYDVVFEENGGPSVEDVKGVYYEASLASTEPTGYVAGETFFTAPGGITYVFQGWYDNEDFYGEPFDFDAEKMPAGNVVLYAKWSPQQYLVQVDPAGGAFTDSAQSTYFQVSHGTPVGAIGVERDFVADPNGDYVYVYETASSDSDGFGQVGYVLAQPGDDGKRYRQSEGTYTLYGWFENTDGSVSSTPFDFNAGVMHDTAIVARWQAAGVFDILYNPVMKVEGGTVTGEIEDRIDPGYSDLSPTFVMNTPTGIKSSNGKDYRFVGWTIVESFEEGAPLLVDGIFVEGDGFVINSELATDNAIHFQAVYEEVPPGESPETDAPEEGEPEGETPEAGEPEGEAPEAVVPESEPNEGEAPEAVVPESEPNQGSPDNGGSSDDGDESGEEAGVNDGGTDASQSDDSEGNVLGLAATPDASDGSDDLTGDGTTDNEASGSADEVQGGPVSVAVASSQQQGEENSSGELLPKTDDSLLALAVGIVGVALIAAGVALMAHVMRRRHDELVNDD